MTGQKWTDYELAIVVYFASRHASHKGCNKILHMKSGGEPRTLQSVRSMLDGIRKIDGLWNSAKGWDIEAVDRWLLTLAVPNLEATVGFSYEELSFIPEVIYYIPPVSFYFNVF